MILATVNFVILIPLVTKVVIITVVEVWNCVFVTRNAAAEFFVNLVDKLFVRFLKIFIEIIVFGFDVSHHIWILSVVHPIVVIGTMVSKFNKFGRYFVCLGRFPAADSGASACHYYQYYLNYNKPFHLNIL